MIVFVTGSESTGKSEITSELAHYFGAPWVPEFARVYLEELKRPYQLADVEEIARHQIQQLIAYRNYPLVFFDTGLVITKIWFQQKYGRVPKWFVNLYSDFAHGHYLLCSPDIPWVPDPVRENPNIREALDKAYEQEVLSLACPLERISGIGQLRINAAIKAVEEWIFIENKKI